MKVDVLGVLAIESCCHTPFQKKKREIRSLSFFGVYDEMLYSLSLEIDSHCFNSLQHLSFGEPQIPEVII